MTCKINSFLYDDRVEEAVTGAETEDWNQLLVSSGRYLGKTTFLTRLRNSLGDWPGAHPRWIDGRSPSAEDGILSWADHPRGLLLVDDLDLVGSQALQALNALFGTEGDWRLVVSFHDSAVLEDGQWSQLSSRHVERVCLDPWEGDWEKAAKEVMSRTAEASRRDDPSGQGPRPAIAEEVVNTWQEVVLEVTGGHPALVGAACKRFAVLLHRSRESSLKPAEQKLFHPEERSPTWRNALRVYLEDYLVEKELPLFAQTVRAVQRRPEVFKHLIALARGDERIKNPFVRKQLRHTGLVYSDREAGILVVVSPLIKQWILHLANEPARSPAQETVGSVLLDVVGESPYDGLMRCEVPAGGTREIPVSGAPWRILRCLAQAENQPVSLNSLVKEANLGTLTAARSAIQRLQSLLRQRGLANVVDNVRGEGYRLGSFPSLMPHLEDSY